MSVELRTISKEQLVASLQNIESRGWIENTTRKTNDGAAGNMLEDLLGIPENNLPIPNAAEWELKTRKDGSASLVTLFHTEPSPRAVGIVPHLLLPNYGWPHSKAGKEYPDDERSFRATLDAISYTRGFNVYVNEVDRKICIRFDATKVLEKDKEWLETVRLRVGHLNDLDVVPYWSLDEIYAKTRSKLLNCFYVIAERKREGGKTFFHFYKAYMLKNFSIDKFLEALRAGYVKIDFDARTGHNHGTKCRIKDSLVPSLYEYSQVVLDMPKLEK